ncbi:hypothetical protein AM391_RS22585 [Kluyvera ascorbata]|nr:hypothetical protein [Kluyvera ascorbata]
MKDTTAKTTAKKVGASDIMLKLLRIRASDTHVLEFDGVDTRFNDCCNWQVMVNGKRVLFSTRTYEHFSDVKSGILATIEAYRVRGNPSDGVMLDSAKAMISVLDAFPSFAALAKHPGRIN